MFKSRMTNGMITVEQADKIILENCKEFPIVEKPLQQTLGAVLREDIKADRDIPSFNKALMDGIAISFSSYAKGQRCFFIQGTQAAGQKAINFKDKGNCVEIMTGAIIPQGCDCVIPIEDVEIKDREAFIKENILVRSLQNIRLEGADNKKGNVLLKKGKMLSSVDIGICSYVGKSLVKVSYTPQVAIISTGNELVDIDVRKLEPFQIRQSNAYALQAAFEATRLFQSKLFHIKDNKKVLTEKIAAILKKFDVVVLSGGVSMGKFDYVPEVLKDLGVKVLFHKVAQKPGKPFWFGRTRDQKLVFALPGNPISTLVCAYRYVIPALQKALGIKEKKEEWAILNSDFKSSTNWTLFLPVKMLPNKAGQVLVEPAIFSGSGDLAALGETDGFIELPRGEKQFKERFVAKFFRWTS